MNSRSHFPAIASLLFLLLATSTPVLGQSRDIRLSYDPWQPVLPAEALIQSGAESGGWTLAVFGTTEWLGDSIVPVLMMQLLKDTALSGPQQKLTSEESRPSGYVRVVVVGERFLVFWRDRRGGDTSIWMRTVDRDGKLGPERKQSDWVLPERGVIVLQTGRVTQLIWNDTSAGGRILRQGIDSLGYPTKEFEVLDSGRASGVMGPFENRVRAVLRVNAPPILLDNGGTKIDDAGWKEKFKDRWHLSRDGAVTTVHSDTLLLVYRNILDMLPEQIIRLQIGEEFCPNSVFPYQRGYDSLGVIYASGSRRLQGSGKLRISVVKATVAPSGKTSNPTITASYEVDNLSHLQTTTFFAMGAKEVYWDGFCRYFFAIYHVVETYWKGGCDHKQDYDKSLLCFFHEKQSAMVDANKINEYQQIALNINHKIITRRIVGENRLLSNIQVDIGDTTVVLSAKVALLRKSIAEENPGLTISPSGNAIVGWVGRGLDTTVGLVPWKVDNDTSVVPSLILRGSRLIGTTIMQSGNRFVAAQMQYWFETTPQGHTWLRRHGHLYFPTDSAWITPAGIDSTIPLTDVEVLSWNQHPETGDFFIQLGSRDNPPVYSQHVVVIGNDAQRVWSIQNPPTSGSIPQIVPVSNNRFFLIDHENFIVETEDSVIHFQKILPHEPYAAIRLLGSYFLRWTTKGLFQRFSFTEDGVVKLVDSVTIQRGSAEFNGMYVVQNPQDSGFAILLPSAKNGVWMLTMNKHLRQVTPLTRIGGSDTLTTTPRAIFRGDSLYVVWIDHRNGVADVYGTVVRPQTVLAVRDPIEASQQGITIIPNPAVGEARVVVGGARSGDRLVVVREVTGREVARSVIRSGGVDGVIDVSGIAAGAYLVNVAGEVGGALLIVEE
ncbi:MAG: hypothetical protein K1X90_01160 [Candidatus Kapabacteria bacterium]|nr:hypothetical protein [Candidatus Kapabacteria bacterium]